jgi:hypothetical protein
VCVCESRPACLFAFRFAKIFPPMSRWQSRALPLGANTPELSARGVLGVLGAEAGRRDADGVT